MEARDLDLNLLLVLDALFEEGTLTRAGRHLRLSQPTMSAALARLRTALGDELFVRTNGVMQPTARAEALRPVVKGILRTIRLEVLSEASFDPERETGVFTLTMSDIGELEFLPRLLAEVARLAPQARLRTLVVSPRELLGAMDTGDIDLAVGYFPDLVSSALVQQLLFRATTACLVRKGHPAIGPGMSLSDYAAAKHIAIAQQGRTHDVVERALASAGVERDVVLEVCHFLSVPFLVVGSDLVATLPRPLALQFADPCDLLVVEPPFVTPTIEIKQFWHRRFDRHPRVRWLRGVIAQVCQNRPRLGASAGADDRPAPKKSPVKR